MRLPNCDWPEGVPLTEMLAALACRGEALRVVGLAYAKKAATRPRTWRTPTPCTFH